ncbi:MAG: polyphosphate polymerase domain-containing protein [Alistipes sp.]|nr:polyphosphate polymerase domain-containing protein [Alistipes sp.]MBO7262936.1 polyphosphate polymerase domain-containing protein [Alistipes sp.]
MSLLATYQNINDLALWQDMGTITLEQMRSVKLMNRIDTKYVASEEGVLRLLIEASKCGYRAQVHGGVIAARYDTRYYDTESRDMYIVHHNRQLTRQKIRTRHYEDGAATYLEVKNKNNRGRTKKKRIEIPIENLMDFAGNSEALSFIEPLARYNIKSLSPAIATRFVRITIVNPELTERITIDLDLEFTDLRSGRVGKIDGMAIIEIKQDGNIRSKAKDILNTLRIKPMRISKYCLGTALTVDGIKRNRMIEKIRRIEKRIANRNN